MTGASRGLGFAIAEALAPAHHVVAVARTVGGLEDLDDRIKAKGGAATLAPMDVADRDAMAHLCRGIHDRWGHADLWVHAAVHAAPLTPAAHVAAKDWETSIRTNATATATLITMVEPLLAAAEDGTALFFDDPQVGQPFFGAYGASKAAQMAIVRSWAAETRRIGPRVRIAEPRPMPTGTRARFFPGEDRAALAECRDEAERLLAQTLGD